MLGLILCGLSGFWLPPPDPENECRLWRSFYAYPCDSLGRAALCGGSSAGKALVPVISEVGKWGMQWVYDGLTEERMNMVVLLREIAVFLKTDQLPAGDTVLQFTFTDLEAGQKQYIVLHDGKREVCDENPGHEVDVYLRSTLRTLAEIWWGDTGLLAAIDDGRLKLGGSAAHTQRIRQWFPVSAFARDNPRFAD
jgi:putative sterol carrier protein